VSRFAGSFLLRSKRKENEEAASVLLHTGKMLKQVQNKFKILH